MEGQEYSQDQEQVVVAKNEVLRVVGEDSRELLNPKSLASPAQASSVSLGDQDVAKVFSKLKG